MKIKIEQLVPLLRKGWVAMDKDKIWYWYERKPWLEDDSQNFWSSYDNEGSFSLEAFDIEPAEDWKNSLIETGDKTDD